MSDFDEVDRTPVGDPSTLLGRVERRLDDRITSQGKRFGAKIDEHTEDLTDIRVWKAGLVGEKGDNGRVGAIAKDVHSIRSWVRGALAGAAGAIVAVILFAVRVGDERGYKRAELEALKAQVADITKERDDLQQIKQALLIKLLTLPPVAPAIGDHQ